MTRRLLRPTPLLALAGVLALLALLAYGVSSKSESQTIDEQVAKGARPAAPDASWPRLGGGGDVSLASLRGQVVVLNFWASWCGPCRSEAPVLQRWQKRLAPRGATLVGVDVLDVTSDAQSFARKYSLSYPLVRDRDGSKSKPFQVLGYPETVVVDRRGRIAATARGPVEDGFFTRKVEPLLKERA